MSKNLPQDHDIAALVPMYDSGGDSTCIYLSNGKKHAHPCRLKTLLHRLVVRRHKNISLLRSWAARHTHRKLWLPLAISWELILLPVRSRRPRICGDATGACINLRHLLSIREQKNQILLQLIGGGTVPVLWSLKTMHQHLESAQLIQLEKLRHFDDGVFRRLKDQPALLN